MYFAYVIESDSTGGLYIGSTQKMTTRLQQHISGMMKSTRGKRPWHLLLVEKFQTRSEALARERQIKSWKNPHYVRSIASAYGQR